MGFKVNQRMCSTCIFGQNSPIPPERFAQLKEQWEREGIVQECHHATLKQEQIACRGHYEAARRGEVTNHPIMEIARQMGLESLRVEQMMGFSESQGWVEFVEVKENQSKE